MSKQVLEKIKKAFEDARVGPFRWWINLNNLEQELLKILEDYIILTKEEKALGDFIGQKLEGKLVVVEKQKIRELADAIKKRPSWEWMKDNLDKLEDIEFAFTQIEKKFDELGLNIKKEKPTK